jgi:hypothetical protein
MGVLVINLIFVVPSGITILRAYTIVYPMLFPDPVTLMWPIVVATLAVVVLVTQFLSVQLHFHWSGVINHLFAGLLAVWWLLVATRLRHLGLAKRSGGLAKRSGAS